MPAPELLISADSHVVEPPDLWAERLPAALRDRAPTYEQFKRADRVARRHAGESNPAARLDEMLVDGVVCEVLYATLALEQFGIPDPALQEACMRVFNDWLIDYCACAPNRLLGLANIATFDIAHAIVELERCKAAGLRGALIWQVPPASLPFAGDHYERFWAAAQDLEMPVSLHILTGEPYRPGLVLEAPDEPPLTHIRHSVNIKLLYAANALLDIIGSGVLDRYPKLKLVLVENEISWLPFVISQWDKYIARGGKYAVAAKELPGSYFGRQIFATFFNDPPSTWILDQWGSDACMWSNDFPHPNSTWPESREVIARDLGHLPQATRKKLLSENAATLYKIDVDELERVVDSAPRDAGGYVLPDTRRMHRTSIAGTPAFYHPTSGRSDR